jgi:hypothetical protein
VSIVSINVWRNAGEILNILLVNFWVVPRRVVFIILPIHLPMKMEETQYSETSVIKHHTPGKNPKDNKQHLEHGENLKTRI